MDAITLEELIAEYTLEPTLADVFVEGSADVRVVEAFLREHRIEHVKVRAVIEVCVPDPAVEALGLWAHSSRNRVVALARRLDRELPRIEERVVCIADRDFEDLHPIVEATGCLRYTDFACMEAYGFTERAVDQFLIRYPFKCPLRWAAIGESLCAIAKRLFSIRAALWCLGHAVAFPKPERLLVVRGNTLEIDEQRLDDILRSRGLAAVEIAAITKEAAGILEELPEDARYALHKDDFRSMLLSIAKPYLKPKLRDPWVFGAAIGWVLDPRDLQETDLFKRVFDLFGTAA